MLVKLVLLRLFLRVNKLSQCLTLLCQITFISLNILVEANNDEEVEHHNMFKCSLCGNYFISLASLSQHKNELHLKNPREFYLENGHVNKDDEIINQEFEVEDSVTHTIRFQQSKNKENRDYVAEEKNIQNYKEQENNARKTDQKPQFECINEPDFNSDLVKTETKSEDEEEWEDKPLLKKFKTDTQKSFPCSQCGNIFSNLKILAKHKNENHVKLKKEQIEISIKDGNSQ